MTGTLFFVPSVDFLDDLPDPPGITAETGVHAEDEAGTTSEVRELSEGSLGIGDLKGSTAR
ncbi:hypothetical protein ACFQX6_34785 [Streptosporangium lutulentum]